MFSAAVLYARKNSIYKLLPGVDVYDKDRDARTFTNDLPIIAHPPCRLFGKLKHFSKAPIEEKLLAYHAVNTVKLCGGVLEHPAHSQLWVDMDLPLPNQFINLNSYQNGFTLPIQQYDFGHKCQKNTWLYINGIHPNQLPAFPLILGKAKERIGDSGSMLTREGTPLALALFMIEIAILCDKRKTNLRLVA
jgi:hypothetical protein